jgi:hypothetical protein
MKVKKIILLILCGLTSHSQATTTDNGYHLMLVEGKVWNYTYHAQSGDMKMSIEVKGDTVINNNNCHKLYLCLPDSRRLYGCFYEEFDGGIIAYMTLDIRKQENALVMQALETAASAKRLYQFQPSAASWTYTYYSGHVKDFYMINDIVHTRSAGYDQDITDSPYPICIGCYELIRIGDDCFARAQITDFQRHDTLETWVSGVGERYWGIMQPIQGVGKYNGGEWVEFESCEENNRLLFSKADFDLDAPHPDYHPIVENNKTWTCSTNPYGADIYYYHLQGDTLIGDQQCLKLYSQNRFNDGTIRYEGALYEKDKKVFMYKSDTSLSTLLYDFSLKQGDIAMLRNGNASNSYGVCAVTDAYEQFNGRLLHNLLFYEVYRFGDNPLHYDDYIGGWIEGVGPNEKMDLLENIGFNLIGGRYGRGIIDCSVNGQSIYRVNEYDSLMIAACHPPLNQKKITASPLFDLQGRRLSKEPAHGVYIQNGRKRIK